MFSNLMDPGQVENGVGFPQHLVIAPEQAELCGVEHDAAAPENGFERSGVGRQDAGPSFWWSDGSEKRLFTTAISSVPSCIGSSPAQRAASDLLNRVQISPDGFKRHVFAQRAHLDNAGCDGV